MTHEDVGGFILAGGVSSRMGRDKALVELCGRPLVAYAVELLQQAHLPAAVVGERPDLARFAPVIRDRTAGRGPLEGICAGMAQNPVELSAYVSVDLPLLPPSALEYLLHHARITGRLATLFSVNGVPQTFPAVVRRDALPVFEEQIRGDHGGCFAAFKAAARAVFEPVSVLPIEMLAQAGQVGHPADVPAAFWFLNVNTPADLAAARRWLPVSIA